MKTPIASIFADLNFLAECPVPLFISVYASSYFYSFMEFTQTEVIDNENRMQKFVINGRAHEKFDIKQFRQRYNKSIENFCSIFQFKFFDEIFSMYSIFVLQFAQGESNMYRIILLKSKMIWNAKYLNKKNIYLFLIRTQILSLLNSKLLFLWRWTLFW